MNFTKSIAKQIHYYLHKHCIKAHFQKFKSFNKCLSYNGMVKLSNAIPGAYKISVTYCNDKLAHRLSEHNHHHHARMNDKLARRLSELGIIPNEKIVVIENRGRKGSVIVKVKGSKIVLNRQVADKILLKRNNYDNQKAYSSCYNR
jgi:Fe2+ transport system protein FeoA